MRRDATLIGSGTLSLLVTRSPRSCGCVVLSLCLSTVVVSLLLLLVVGCRWWVDMQYGTKDPNLWVNVLTYFASKDSVPEEELQEVLQHIEREALLQPMLIIQILAKNPNLPISVIR